MTVVDTTMAPEEEEKSSEEEEDPGDGENGGGFVTEVDRDEVVETDAADEEEDVNNNNKKKKHMKVAADAPWKDRMWEGACIAFMHGVGRLLAISDRPSRLWLASRRTDRPTLFG